MDIDNYKVLIEREYSVGSDDIIMTEFGILHDVKIRISIRSDSFQKQCHAHLSTLDQNKQWKVLISIPYSNMKTEPKLYYHLERPNNKITNKISNSFLEDRLNLLRKADKILGN